MSRARLCVAWLEVEQGGVGRVLWLSLFFGTKPRVVDIRCSWLLFSFHQWSEKG